jgi:hypothetical protein
MAYRNDDSRDGGGCPVCHDIAARGREIVVCYTVAKAGHGCSSAADAVTVHAYGGILDGADWNMTG